MLVDILRFTEYELVALFDNNINVKSPFSTVPFYHDKNHLENFKKCGFAVAIGGSRGVDRVNISNELESLGFYPVTLVHQTAYVANDSKIGKGVQVLPMSKICPRTKIGDYSIINTGASVDHESKLGQGVHLGPNSVLCGCVHVGDYSFIGANATILPRITIGNNVIVGAGAVVTKDICDDHVVVGAPAKPLEKHKNRKE